MTDKKVQTEKKAKGLEDRARGDRAARLIADPLIEGFFKQCGDEIEAAWKGSAIDQVEVREDAYRLLHALGRLKRCFAATIEAGKFAAAELELTAREEKATKGQPKE